MQIDAVFNSPFIFEEVALTSFKYQASQPGIYKDYLNSLKINPEQVIAMQQIPFLPISFFKTHEVKDKNKTAEIIFTSSGTSGMDTSSHFVTNLNIYINSFPDLDILININIIRR